MIVKTTPNGKAFREGYLRTEEDGVFRLYATPPDRPDDPHYDHANRAAFAEANPDIPESAWPKIDPRVATKEDEKKGIVMGREGPSRLKKWLGPSLVVASDRERAAFEGSAADVSFGASGAANDPDAVMNRGAQIAIAVHKLDHENPGALDAGRPAEDRCGRGHQRADQRSSARDRSGRAGSRARSGTERAGAVSPIRG